MYMSKTFAKKNGTLQMASRLFDFLIKKNKRSLNL